MSDLNPDGAYMIRVGAKRFYLLSLKYRDQKDNQFKVADYRIKRTDPENYRQNIFYTLQKKKIFYTLHKNILYNFTIGQVRKAGVEMEQPQEFDDPNTTISNILDRLRRFGVTIDFAPSKLKQGYGEQALFVLDRLSDEALRATQFTWSQPEAPEEEAKEDEEMEDDAEVLLDRVEEDMAGETSDEEEEDILHIDDFKNYHQNKVDRYHY